MEIDQTWIINWTSLMSKPRAATLVATNVVNFPALKPFKVTYKMAMYVILRV